MDHAVAVRAEQREIGEVGLGGSRDVKRNAMMALDEVGASFAVGALENHKFHKQRMQGVWSPSGPQIAFK